MNWSEEHDVFDLTGGDAMRPERSRNYSVKQRFTTFPDKTELVVVNFCEASVMTGS